MTYLLRPRAHFQGPFTLSTPTANNDKVSLVIDEANVEVVNPSNMSDADYRVWMMQTISVPNPNAPPTIWLNSYFNYFGDGSMKFGMTNDDGSESRMAMTSSILADGTVYTPGNDALLNCSVELLGHPFFDKSGTAKMVDLDPIGIYATQIFSGEFRLVNYSNPQSPLVMLSGKNPTRAYIRYLNFDRNIAPQAPGPQMGAAVWEMGLPLADLTFNNQGLYTPTLQALQMVAQAGQGLMVRYVTYYVLDGIPESELAEKFQQSGYQDPIVNNSTGLIVGTIGAWANNDPLVSIPVGRMLYPNASNPLTRPTSQYTIILGRDKAPAAPANSATPPPPYFLAPATVMVDTQNNNVVLDFCTTIPEDVAPAQDDPSSMEKTNYGDLTLTITPQQGTEQTVGTIPFSQYNMAAYTFAGGIIEVPYASNLESILTAPGSQFKIYQQNSSVGAPLVLQEINYDMVAADDQCLYLTQSESVTYKVKVLGQGQPLANTTLPLTISQYDFYAQNPPNPTTQLVLKNMEPLGGTGQPPLIVSLPISAQASTGADGVTYYTTDQNGDITFTVSGLRPGAVMMRYQALGDNLDPNMGGGTLYHYFGYTFYNAFRVLPNDNYDSVPDSQITWDFIYKEVFSYYYLMYPGMFARLPLQNEDTALQFVTIIKQMISERAWNSTSYMPVTRELSDGKRKLVQRWCALNE